MNSFQAKLRQIPYYGSLALLIYMPFHIFISQWLSTFTGGLGVWKGAKDAVTFMLLLVSVVSVWACANRKQQKLYWVLFLLSTLYFLFHISTYLINKDTSLKIAALATAYNCRLFAYMIIGWSAAILTPEKFKSGKIIKIVLLVSTIVCLIGLLQYILPKDIMTHFGYSLERGARPAFFIDDKPDLPRIMSTIRDPNSLAAFLIIPITLIWAYLLDNKHKERFMLLFGLLGVHLLALFLAFSRAGWAGALLSVAIVTIYLKKSLLKVWAARFGLAIVLSLSVLAFGAYTLRDQYFVQHVIFHSDESTAASMDSNDLHASFVQQGLEALASKPQGHGPGTAGIVSIQKPSGGLLTENYFLQIGYEIGLAGLMLFLAMMIFTQKKLTAFKNSTLATTLAAAFWGFLLISLVSHLWTNEAVAVQWWLLAGMVGGHTGKIVKNRGF